MILQPAITIAIALIPFLAAGGLLWIARRRGRRREASIARQMALTDAIHRELGAAAAPQVWRDWSGKWTVAMAVPLDREATVAALTRITHRFFAKVDHADPPAIRVVLTPLEPRPARGPAAIRAGGPLSRAA